ncbi:hypothetical protein CGLO_18228 [Colletotrichum gloeosporioides Cg-14]|uniref:Uncharacterized protein n=1 Tax=Colletotrichum gloeosporioides (strain Cg-14) TaxID=1237896 RepID=T0KV34_COLGC|nr:hypothetical protein CGLO_18228 [Colletotrichum gloeosporioides Cg-14]
MAKRSVKRFVRR